MFKKIVLPLTVFLVLCVTAGHAGPSAKNKKKGLGPPPFVLPPQTPVITPNDPGVIIVSPDGPSRPGNAQARGHEKAKGKGHEKGKGKGHEKFD